MALCHFPGLAEDSDDKIRDACAHSETFCLGGGRIREHLNVSRITLSFVKLGLRNVFNPARVQF